MGSGSWQRGTRNLHYVMTTPSCTTSLDETLNICVLFETVSSPWGGGNQFLAALTSELSQLGHKVATRPTRETQIVLLNGFNRGANERLELTQVAQLRQSGKMTALGRIMPTSLQMKRLRRGPALVHRVDGVPELVRGRRTKADEVQPAVNRLTDYTIFQSEYCRTSFTEQCGFSPEHSTVIHNAVDPSLFYPRDAEAAGGGPLRLIAVSWSSNRRKGFDTLAEMVEAARRGADLRRQLVPRGGTREREAGGGAQLGGTGKPDAFIRCYGPRRLERTVFQCHSRSHGLRSSNHLSRFRRQS